MLLDQQPAPASDSQGLNFLPPAELNVPLWRSLLVNLRDFVTPDRRPPLKLTSRPVNIGMTLGDRLSVPWYRTILSGIGDLISPDTLPPLQLESQPVEVELISDEPAWWQSLLRNLADTVAPEKLPALRLTSASVNPEMASDVLVTPRWSAMIARPTPKVLPRDPWRTPSDTPVRVAPPMRTELIHLSSLELDADAPAADESERKLVRQLKRSIHWSRIRQVVWISVAAAEILVVVLVLAR